MDKPDSAAPRFYFAPNGTHPESCPVPGSHTRTACNYFREQLAKYGQHLPGCTQTPAACSCGLIQAMLAQPMASTPVAESVAAPRQDGQSILAAVLRLSAPGAYTSAQMSESARDCDSSLGQLRPMLLTLQAYADAAAAACPKCGATFGEHCTDAAPRQPEGGEHDEYLSARERKVAEKAAPKSEPEGPQDLSSASEALAFFASVIKSGESWSSSCQEAYDKARAALAAQPAASESPLRAALNTCMEEAHDQGSYAVIEETARTALAPVARLDEQRCERDLLLQAMCEKKAERIRDPEHGEMGIRIGGMFYPMKTLASPLSTPLCAALSLLRLDGAAAPEKLSPAPSASGICDCGLMVETHATGDGSVREHKPTCAIKRGGRFGSPAASLEVEALDALADCVNGSKLLSTSLEAARALLLQAGRS